MTRELVSPYNPWLLNLAISLILDASVSVVTRFNLNHGSPIGILIALADADLVTAHPSLFETINGFPSNDGSKARSALD